MPLSLLDMGPLNGPPRQQSQALVLQHHQAFHATSPVPINIVATLRTRGLMQPDPQWYMDTGATSHMTSISANLSSYSN